MACARKSSTSTSSTSITGVVIFFCKSWVVIAVVFCVFAIKSSKLILCFLCFVLCCVRSGYNQVYCYYCSNITLVNLYFTLFYVFTPITIMSGRRNSSNVNYGTDSSVICGKKFVEGGGSWVRVGEKGVSTLITCSKLNQNSALAEYLSSRQDAVNGVMLIDAHDGN